MWYHAKIGWPGMGFGNQLISLGNALTIAAKTQRKLLVGSFNLHYLPDPEDPCTMIQRPFFSIWDRCHFHRVLQSFPCFQQTEAWDALDFDPQSQEDARNISGEIQSASLEHPPWENVSHLSNPMVYSDCNLFCGLSLFAWNSATASILGEIFQQLHLVPPLQLCIGPRMRRPEMLAIHLRVEDDWIAHMLMLSTHYPQRRRTPWDGRHGTHSLRILVLCHYIWKIQEIVRDNPHLTHIYLMSGLFTKPNEATDWIFPRLKEELRIRCPELICFDHLSTRVDIPNLLQTTSLSITNRSSRDFFAMMDFAIASSQASVLLTTDALSCPLQSTFSLFLRATTSNQRTYSLNFSHLEMPEVILLSAYCSSCTNAALSIDVLDKIIQHAVIQREEEKMDFYYYIHPSQLVSLCEQDVHLGHEKCLDLHFAISHPLHQPALEFLVHLPRHCGHFFLTPPSLFRAMNRIVAALNVANHVTDKELLDLFLQHGTVQSYKIVRKDGKLHVMYAFFTFSTPTEAQRAILHLNHKVLGSGNEQRAMKVELKGQPSSSSSLPDHTYPKRVPRIEIISKDNPEQELGRFRCAFQVTRAMSASYQWLLSPIRPLRAENKRLSTPIFNEILREARSLTKDFTNRILITSSIYNNTATAALTIYSGNDEIKIETIFGLLASQPFLDYPILFKRVTSSKFAMAESPVSPPSSSVSPVIPLRLPQGLSDSIRLLSPKEAQFCLEHMDLLIAQFKEVTKTPPTPETTLPGLVHLCRGLYQML